MSGKLDDMLFNPGRPSYTEMERENVNLRQRLVAVIAERDAMMAAVVNADLERDKLEFKLKGVITFCEAELGWMFFRAEYRIGENPTLSEMNTMKLRDYLKEIDAMEAPSC